MFLNPTLFSTYTAVVGIDIAKNVNQVYMVTAEGEISNKAVKRNHFLSKFTNVGPYLIGMEACGGSQYWGRELEKLGHTVRLMSPKEVKQFVSGLKNDKNDAVGIYTALVNGVRQVPVKPAAKRDLDLLLTMRNKILKDRIASSNHVRGILLEYGIVMSKSYSKFCKETSSAMAELEQDSSVSAAVIFQLRDTIEEISRLNERVKKIEKDIEVLAIQDKNYEHFLTAPGIGKLTAAKMTILLTDPKVFKNGRQFAAFLGLTPMSFGSGGHNMVTTISKYRCDAQVRSMMVQCAHSASRSRVRSQWLDSILARKPRAVAVIAIANRLARNLWAMAFKDEIWKLFVRDPEQKVI